MKNIYRTREYVENVISWGVPPCKLFVDSLGKYMIFDRDNAQNKAERFRISLSQSLVAEKTSEQTGRQTIFFIYIAWHRDALEQRNTTVHNIWFERVSIQ